MQYRILIFILFIAFSSATFGPQARAQISTPEVQVDLSVLQALDPSIKNDGRNAAPLQRNANPDYKPLLTNKPPAATPAPRQEKERASLRPGTVVPPLPASKPSAPSAKRAAASALLKSGTAVSPFMPMPGEAPVTAAAAAPAPAPVTAGINPEPELKTPLPGQKPEETKKVKVSSVKTPPLPPRRPAKQKASESFVTSARAQNLPREIKPAGASGFPMPAVPALPVKMEELPRKKTAVTDKLEAQLFRADREKILKAVEDIADQREGKAVKSEAMPSSITANDLKKTMSEPYVRKKSMPDDITATEPAAGGEKMAKADVRDITARMIPRPPPQEKFEEDYISMPFQAGKDALDDGTLAVMQESVLAQLQNNPSWRIQIQAFASPTEEGSSSARRLSLARALAVRTWLMDKGIEAGRMDVRALGMQTDRNPADRVDLIIFNPKNG